MAANVFLDLPGGLKMPALGIGTWQVSLEYSLNYFKLVCIM
jgi:diketogulonate reductase-like aldo/keto reductase